MPEISIVIPVYNEEKYIATCIESILSSTYDTSKMEILLIDGNSQDNTVAMIEPYVHQYVSIKLLKNPERYTPISMNIGICESVGKYIFILSAHAKYDVDYFTKLEKSIVDLSADCVGGVLVTEVKEKTKTSLAIKEVLQNRFGVGNASFRIGSPKIFAVDTVAFGCYKRETFEKYGLFDERLTRNQDIELNKRIINGGGKIYLIPDVKCTYFARENFTDLAQNNYGNGYWNILTAYYTKTFRSLGLRHFVPLFFVLSLVIPVLMAPFYPLFLWISIFSLASYLTLVIIVSLKIKNNTNSVKYLIMSFITLHLSYGWGSFMGIFAVLRKMIKGEK